MVGAVEDVRGNEERQGQNQKENAIVGGILRAPLGWKVVQS